MTSNKSMMILLINIVSLSCILLISTTHASRLIPSPEMAPAPSGAPFEDPAKTREIWGDFTPQVVSFCKAVEFPLTCAETIAPYVEGPQVDPMEALKIEMEATLEKSMKVSKGVKKDLKRSSLDEAEREAFELCHKIHKSIQETIKETNVLLDQQNVPDAYFKFSLVSDDAFKCNKAIYDLHEKDDHDTAIPYAYAAADAVMLGGNCLSIMDNIVS